ncbi:MAG: ribosomal protein L7/L12 [Bacteroidales bacterium]|nr:ribosomal protein L7/L12 [Bacteroidales bacterium]
MNTNINLTDLDLMAMFRVAKEIAGLDNNITVEEGEVFVRYARPLNMSEGRMDRFISVAVNMDWQNAVDTIKDMSPELKQYASNFLAEVALADGEVSDEEDRAYNTFLEICDLPYTNIGQDDDSGTAAQSKYSKQELCAINEAFLRVWDSSDAGKAVKSVFWERYDVYGETGSMSDDEADSVLYVMSDEKKEEVSRMLLEVILSKDPDDKVFCEAVNIECYYDLVLSTGLPDLLTDHVLDYKNEEDEDDCGETPKGLRFTLQDLYAVWSIVKPNFSYCALSYPIDVFFDDFHVNEDIFSKLQEDSYLKNLNIYDSEERISRLGTSERNHISTILAETISANLDDEDIGVLLSEYKTLVDDYGLPDCLADFFDGHGISEYRSGKQAIIREVKIEPDLFVDGLSQTKIKVTVNVKGCKDGELRLIASVYHADDDTPVPAPNFRHYGTYSWDYDDVGFVLSVHANLFPTYDFSGYTDVELLLPNDLLPADRDYYIKVCVYDLDEMAFISYPFHTQGYRFKATKNEYDPDLITLQPTYIVVSYFEKDRKKIPGDYRDYRPCTIRFEQPLFGDFDRLKKSLGAESLQSKIRTGRLDEISEKLDLHLPEKEEGLKLCISFDENGAHGYNKLRDLAGLFGNDEYYETLVVCLQDTESDGTVYGFRYVSQLREVLNALDEAVYGLAYNGPVYDQPALAEAFKRRFWWQVEKELGKLNYESVNLSERATEIPPKSVKVTETKVSHVVLNGENHVRLTMSCQMDGCKGLSFTGECEACYAVDGSTIDTKDYKYMQGYPNILCISKLFKPSYNSSTYSDVEFDFPQRLLPQKSAYEFKIAFYRNPTFQPIGNAVVVGSKTETPTNTGKSSGAYNVIIKSAGAKKLVVIKLAMEIMHSDLKKAKDLVDAVPKMIKTCANKDEAYALKAQLEAAGAEVEVIYCS